MLSTEPVASPQRLQLGVAAVEGSAATSTERFHGTGMCYGFVMSQSTAWVVYVLAGILVPKLLFVPAIALVRRAARATAAQDALDAEWLSALSPPDDSDDGHGGDRTLPPRRPPARDGQSRPSHRRDGRTGSRPRRHRAAR
jgi:hypothetical protein